MPRFSLETTHLTIEGVPALIQAGSLHYYRLPHRDLWKPVLDQLRVGGFNAVRVPFPWAYHSPAEGYYDLTGPRDINVLLDTIADAGLWLIADVGPWVDSHLSAGGIPAWLWASQACLPFTLEQVKQGPSPAFLRHLAVWWHSLFPHLVKQPNHILTFMHPGRWSFPVGLGQYMQPLRELAEQCGMVTPWAWPCSPPELEQMVTNGEADVWTIHDDRSTVTPKSSGEHTVSHFAVVRTGQSFLVNGPDTLQILRQKRLDHPRSIMKDLLTGGYRMYAIDPAHKGCNWGNGSARRFATMYGLGAPIDEQYGDLHYYRNARRFAMTTETLGKIFLSPSDGSTIYAAPADNLIYAHTTSIGSVAVLETGSKTVQHLRLTQPNGDDIMISDEIDIPEQNIRMLPLNLPVGNGVIRSTTLEPLLITEVAGRTLCIVRNDNHGSIHISDDFRPKHVRGLADPERVADGWNIHFGKARLSSLVLDGTDQKLQLLALDASFADLVWPLDDTWRSTSAYPATWSPELEEPARGVVIGPDLVVPEVDGGYRYLVSAKGFGYRWGPWRGSDPRTWLAPISWSAPVSLELPELHWETKPGALENLPDYPDDNWRALPVDGLVNVGLDEGTSDYIWYRGSYTGYAETVTLLCHSDCDVFLNGYHIATLKVPFGKLSAGAKSIPLPGKYQGQNNVLAFLVDKGGRTPELDTAQQKLGLVSCKLSQDAPIYWRVREGLLGEHRVQGFFGYADWRLISPGGTDFITWHRSIFNMDIEQGIVQPTYLILEPTPAKVGIYLNGMLIGRSWYNNTSQTRFWLPEGVLKKQGENELLIAQWTRGSAPRLGQTRLESGVIRKWHKDVFRAK